MFRPFSGWAIIRLGLEYQRKFIYYNVDIKYGKFENTVVLRRIFIHSVPTSIESHNGDDATKDTPSRYTNQSVNAV
jgi:hypothetical protein